MAFNLFVAAVVVIVVAVTAVALWEAPIAEARLKACQAKGGILLSARDIKPSSLCIRKDMIIDLGELK